MTHSIFAGIHCPCYLDGLHHYSWIDCLHESSFTSFQWLLWWRILASSFHPDSILGLATGVILVSKILNKSSNIKHLTFFFLLLNLSWKHLEAMVQAVCEERVPLLWLCSVERAQEHSMPPPHPLPLTASRSAQREELSFQHRWLCYWSFGKQFYANEPKGPGWSKE